LDVVDALDFGVFAGDALVGADAVEMAALQAAVLAGEIGEFEVAP